MSLFGGVCTAPIYTSQNPFLLFGSAAFLVCPYRAMEPAVPCTEDVALGYNGKAFQANSRQITQNGPRIDTIRPAMCFASR